MRSLVKVILATQCVTSEDHRRYIDILLRSTCLDLDNIETQSIMIKALSHLQSISKADYEILQVALFYCHARMP